MAEPGFGEIEYDSSINTPSKSEAYFKAFHDPLITGVKAQASNGKVTVLNVACGPGHEFEFMANDPVLRLVGFDISPELIKQAQDRYKGKPASADFLTGDTKNPPIADNSVDVGMAVNAVIYSPGAVLDTLHNALKEGGKCAVNFRVYGNKFNDPFYDTQVRRGATLEDEEIDANGEKFKLKVVNYATHADLSQLGRQVYFTSDGDIDKFIAAKGFAVEKHKKFHYASPDNKDNEVEVYTLRKPEIKNIEISTMYRESGDDLILFLPGLGCIKESFGGAWKAQDLNGYSLLAPDFVGYGESSRPAYFSYSMEDQARRVLAEFEKYPHKKVNIVAHSSGGAVGLFLAEMLGDRLGTFISVEGSLNVAGPASVRTAATSFGKFNTSLFGEIKSSLAQSSEPGWKLWVGWMQKADPLGFYRSSKDLVSLINSGKLVRRFQELQARKVYMYGERSSQRLVPVFATIQDIQKVMIPNSEHFSMTDNPQAFYDQLSQILSK